MQTRDSALSLNPNLDGTFRRFLCLLTFHVRRIFVAFAFRRFAEARSFSLRPVCLSIWNEKGFLSAYFWYISIDFSCSVTVWTCDVGVPGLGLFFFVVLATGLHTRERTVFVITESFDMAFVDGDGCRRSPFMGRSSNRKESVQMRSLSFPNRYRFHNVIAM